jgi:hypothetical protein
VNYWLNISSCRAFIKFWVWKRHYMKKDCQKISIMASMSQAWWLMPVILATWEAGIRGIAVWGQPGQIVSRSHLQNNQSKMDWRCVSSQWTGVPALQV